MSTDFATWAARHPQAARELLQMLDAVPTATSQETDRPEAWAQQQVRLQLSAMGVMSWRNNVGATPTRCKSCNAPQQPVRYGLANDSAKLNESIKSSDLILAIPRVISAADVGRTIAQFGSIECKQPGWTYKGTPREAAQAKWLALINKIGGYAAFSTGEVNL